MASSFMSLASNKKALDIFSLFIRYDYTALGARCGVNASQTTQPYSVEYVCIKNVAMGEVFLVVPKTEKRAFCLSSKLTTSMIMVRIFDSKALSDFIVDELTG